MKSLHADSRPATTTWCSLILLAISLGCGGDSATGPGSSLTILTNTAGGLVDADGYSVTVGNHASVAVVANGSVTVNGLQNRRADGHVERARAELRCYRTKSMDNPDSVGSEPGA